MGYVLTPTARTTATWSHASATHTEAVTEMLSTPPSTMMESLALIPLLALA